MSTSVPNNQMQCNYHGARVLVTGGSNGIGYAIASAFASAGATVTITGTAADAQAYDNDLSAFHYQTLQVKDRDAIFAVAEGLSGLDILVNNAGASLPGGRSEYEPEIFEESVRINLFSAYHMAYACREKLQASTLAGGASILGIASLTSFFGNEMVPGYGAAKAGLVQLTKTLAMSWARDGIRANAIAAGMIDTRMTHFLKDMPEMIEPFMARTPLKRWGLPADIANTALFLASANASFITGQTLLVDGGYSIAG